MKDVLEYSLKKLKDAHKRLEEGTKQTKDELYKEKLLLRNCKNNRPAENFTLDRKAGSDFIPVEVKYTMFISPKPGRSFIDFIKKYNPPRGLILTKGFRGEIKIDNTEVLFAPVWFV